MQTFLVGSLVELGKHLIQRVWPDPAQQAQAQMALLEMEQKGELAQLAADLQLALAQAEINKIEAQSPDFWRSGWRPFIGWICGTGLGYQFLLRPILQMCTDLAGYDIILVSLETETLMTLVFGMLGLGAMRTVEKIKKV